MTEARTTWGVGDYARMAVELEPAAAAVVDAGAVRAGSRVLDVATGTGNAAVIAARRKAVVTAVDAEPVLLDQARRRTAASGLGIRFVLGDLEHLPVPPDSADVVLSVFGVMYATDHGAAARELARVAVPGGSVVIAAWRPGGILPSMGPVLAPYLPPPPPSTGPPGLWGDADSLDLILGTAGLRLVTSSDHLLCLTFDDPAAGADFLIATAGHIATERERLVSIGAWVDLQRDLEEFVQDRSIGPGTTLNLDYLVATAVGT